VDLSLAIADVTAGVPLRQMRDAAASLSARYRDADASEPGGTLSDLERLAYLVVRMPATAASLSRALGELRDRTERPLENLLDLGCGPGTSLWAATDALPALAEATLVDDDPGMLALGERLWQRHPRREPLRVRWGRAPLVGGRPWPAHDVVLLSYVMGELRPDAAASVLSHAQVAARAALVVVEPGTPRGFGRVLAARDALIGTGWRVVAPCPHDRDCPLRAATKGGAGS
jgi:ribosomal protein RSM22 (predicted rRNA methylase)